MKFDSVQQTIGNTPLVRLNKLTDGMKATIYAKLEYFNPGGSIKDRIGESMVDEAIEQGKLKPGGLIIECTSGNTGIGVALAAKKYGCRCIFTTNDKQSREKLDMLKAFGTEVIICPTAVAPEDPRHFVQVAKKINRENPGSFLCNQYDNPSNWRAHYKTTGPELWDDTDGKITHFVAGMGTCGTITGIGKYLKEKNSDIQVVGVDPVGSILYDYFKTGKIVQGETYKVEGIGEDFFPKIIDWNVIDDIVRVDDKESFLMARRLAQAEGMFAGGSSGSAVAGALKYARQLDENAVVVVILPDSGMRYLTKIYNDEWMRDNQYLEAPATRTIEEVFHDKLNRAVEYISADASCSEALSVIREKEFSQLPVSDGKEILGTIFEDKLITEALKGGDLKEVPVRELMGKPLPIFAPDASLSDVMMSIPSVSPAVLVKSGKFYSIITKYDLLRVVGDSNNNY